MTQNFRPFRYLLDPLYVGAVALYLVNRLMIKPSCDILFFHAYLNDVIFVPFTVPPMLFVLRLLRLRSENGPPSYWEVFLPCCVIAPLFEVVLPNTEYFAPHTVADPFDVVAYFAGGAASYLFWKIYYSGKKNG